MLYNQGCASIYWLAVYLGIALEPIPYIKEVFDEGPLVDGSPIYSDAFAHRNQVRRGVQAFLPH